MKRLVLWIFTLMLIWLPLCACGEEDRQAITFEAFLYRYAVWMTWQNKDSIVLEEMTRSVENQRVVVQVGNMTCVYRSEDGALLSLSASMSPEDSMTVSRMAALTAALANGQTLNEAQAVKWIQLCTEIAKNGSDPVYPVGAYGVGIGTDGTVVQYNAVPLSEQKLATGDVKESAAQIASTSSLLQNAELIEQAAHVYGLVKTESGPLKLRDTASEKGKVLARIPNGSSVEIIKEGADWCAVCYEDIRGYVMTKFLNPDGYSGD